MNEKNEKKPELTDLPLDVFELSSDETSVESLTAGNGLGEEVSYRVCCSFAS